MKRLLAAPVNKTPVEIMIKTGVSVIRYGAKYCPNLKHQGRTVNQKDNPADMLNSYLNHDVSPEEFRRANLSSLRRAEMYRFQILRTETKRGCTKVVCNSQEGAKARSEALRPGQDDPWYHPNMLLYFYPVTSWPTHPDRSFSL